MISCLELAALCGVSHGTVDRAMHGRPGVSAATRAKILAMAELHGYRPNPAAREMMGLAASTVVGMAVPDRTLEQPFFLDLFAALARHLREAGLQLSIWVAPEDTPGLEDTVAAMATRRLRALIVIGPPQDLRLAKPLLAAQPVISLMHPCGLPGVRTLMADEPAAARVATEHLIALGHRRIVHLMGSLALHAVRVGRRDGYLAAMAAAGLEPRVWALDAADPGLADALRREGVTAVLCHHDPMATDLIRRLVATGMTVPGAISVMGLSHSRISRVIDPALTSVPYPHDAIAAQVLAVVMGREPDPLPPPMVVPGATTAPPVHP